MSCRPSLSKSACTEFNPPVSPTSPLVAVRSTKRPVSLANTRITIREPDLRDDEVEQAVAVQVLEHRAARQPEDVETDLGGDVQRGNGAVDSNSFGGIKALGDTVEVGPQRHVRDVQQPPRPQVSGSIRSTRSSTAMARVDPSLR